MFCLKNLPVLLVLSLLLSGACSRKNQPANPETTGNPSADQRDEAVDFLATGNEPFWSVEIDLDGNLTYRTAESGRVLSVPLPEAEVPHNGNSVSYQVQSGSHALNVAITAAPCQDDMSGADFPYTVELQIGGQTHRGCGRYTREQPLDTAQWTLVSLGGAPVNAGDYPRGLPFLAFDLEQNRVTGNAGCNSLSGPVTVSGDQLTFGPLITTKMACPAMAFETRLLQALDNSTVSYTLLPGRLVLGQGDTALEFRRGTRTR